VIRSAQSADVAATVESWLPEKTADGMIWDNMWVRRPERTHLSQAKGAGTARLRGRTGPTSSRHMPRCTPSTTTRRKPGRTCRSSSTSAMSPRRIRNAGLPHSAHRHCGHRRRCQARAACRQAVERDGRSGSEVVVAHADHIRPAELRRHGRVGDLARTQHDHVLARCGRRAGRARSQHAPRRRSDDL
jgi:hypothetical protein